MRRRVNSWTRSTTNLFHPNLPSLSSGEPHTQSLRLPISCPSTRKATPARAAAMSDDFLFDDDIVLDEATLAILDAEESKYFGSVAGVQSNLRPAPTQPTPPPAKRQRTDDDGGWKHPATGSGNGSGKLVSRNQKRSDSFYEDLPDISLAGDGVYGVYSQGSHPPQSSNVIPSAAVKNIHNPLGRRSLSGGFQQLAIAPAPAPTPPPRERTSSLNQSRQPPRPPPQSNLTHNPSNSNRPQPQHQHRQQPPHPQQQTPNQTRGPVSRTGPIPPQPNRPQHLGLGRNINVLRQQPQQQQARHVTPVPAHPAQSTSSNPVGGTISDKHLHDEVARLRVQLERVRGCGITIIDLCR